MKVEITKFDVEQKIKNNGIQLDIHSPDGNVRLGDLQITKTKIVWCKGQKHTKNGVSVTWAEFIAWMESD